uniref:Uncharacterized protein LOC113798231 n=1 Tax=Dermatophagoides pteronyssinus TaxID=6956 RepID=A0A6P6YGC1_DERPT|nr:uncharacterized protein LOC113798231 [Dermatophagoides pteronyssinus]
MIDNNDRYTAYINVELNFPTSVSIGSTLHDNTLQNADIIIAIHPPNLLPTMLDTEFYRIDPNNLYEIQFTKEVTKLKEEPYRTNCTKYNPFDRQSEINTPRSRNECVNLCILRESLNNKNDQQQQQKCIYYHNVISSYMLNYFEGKLDTMNAKFCTSRNYLSYVNFTKIRSQCYKDCHPDCIEENYKTTIDVSIIDDDDDNDNDDGKIFTSAVGPFLIDERFFATGFNSRDNSIETANVNKKQTKSMIIIWPNREMYREVEHEGEINFFELIGCLGGHAHIWLGLSIIQFYDVFADLISRIRYSWELIRQKFQFIQKIYPKQRKPYNRCRPFSTSLNHQR